MYGPGRAPHVREPKGVLGLCSQWSPGAKVRNLTAFLLLLLLLWKKNHVKRVTTMS